MWFIVKRLYRKRILRERREAAFDLLRATKKMLDEIETTCESEFPAIRLVCEYIAQHQTKICSEGWRSYINPWFKNTACLKVGMIETHGHDTLLRKIADLETEMIRLRQMNSLWYGAVVSVLSTIRGAEEVITKAQSLAKESDGLLPIDQILSGRNSVR